MRLAQVGQLLIVCVYVFDRTSPCLISGWKAICPSQPNAPSATRRAARCSGTISGPSLELEGDRCHWCAQVRTADFKIPLFLRLFVDAGYRIGDVFGAGP